MVTMIIKTQKLKGTTILTVPSNIETVSEYDVYEGQEGQIIYTPKGTNPFLDSKFVATHDFSQKEAFAGHEVGSELSEDDSYANH